MAEIVFAAGAPHAPGLIGLLEAAPPDVKDVVTTTYRSLTKAIQEAKADVLIVFANDHLANSRVRTYPDFLIGMAAEHRGPYEWFKPWIGCEDYTVKGSPEIAAALFNGMTKRGIRMFAQNENLKFDDNISVPVLLTNIEGAGIPVVPVLQNCTVPPIPDQYRCYEVGKALGDFIRHDLPKDMRVALLGSGGLSHEPGGARYYFIDEEFDRWFLDLVASGDHEKLLKELTLERMEAAGSGGTAELLAWMVVLGAIGPKPGQNFGYTVHKEFKCGVGAVLWDVNANTPQRVSMV
jgi:aromatic ring-opening dioxygenase catalytic subunit (LigB family)